MPKTSTRGLEIYLSQSAKPAPADVLMSVTNAKPAVVTPTTIANYTNGDVVLIEGTGLESLDDQMWVVANITASTFELECSDASTEAAAAASGTAKVYGMYGVHKNMAKWCLTSYSYDQPQAENIDLSTFCGTESASGTPQPASYSVAGYSDGCEEGFREMMAALKDGQPRLLAIKKPVEPPAYVFQMVDVSSFSESYELNAGVSFTSGGAIKSGPFWRDCASCITYLPVTVAVAGTGTATATLTFAGGPADKAYTITLTSNAGADITGLTPVSVAKGMSADAVAAAVAAELDGKQDAGATITLAATATGSVVSVTEAGGANVDTLTAVIA